MYDIVGIGASLYDTLMVVHQMPEEDTKMLASRTLGQGAAPVQRPLQRLPDLEPGQLILGSWEMMRQAFL